ncbi:MAG: HNH endonuclease [Candidatus Zambryskibacteria bacterium]|nr:HNH endonuclease [Candidatus Zambryskibacteria bacterium]
MYHNKQWLSQKYYQEKLFFSDIAKICNVEPATILRWFKKLGLKARSPSERHMGEWNGRWKGGSYLIKHSKDRYIRMITKDGKRVVEHRLVLEKSLGRKLDKEETVHHLDGNSTNNDINNLLLLPSNSEHRRYETTLNNFAKQILFGKLKPYNHKQLLELFNQMLLKSGQDIST